MKSFSIAFLLVSTAIALQCTQYAEILFGDMNILSPLTYKAALRDVGQFGVVKNQTCSKEQKCVGDAYLLTDQKTGQRAAMIWTTCWHKTDDKYKFVRNSECYWNRKNSTKRTTAIEDQFRCVCDARDNCQSVSHLMEQFHFAHGDILKP